MPINISQTLTLSKDNSIAPLKFSTKYRGGPVEVSENIQALLTYINETLLPTITDLEERLAKLEYIKEKEENSKKLNR